MNWDAVSAIGEIVGAAAVVVSLVYLAVQVRGSAKATRASIHQGLHNSGEQLSLALLSHPKLAGLVERGLPSDLTLTYDEQAQFSMAMSQLFNNYEHYYFLWHEGMFSADVASAMESLVARRLQLPGVNEWWQSHHGSFSPEFVRWANAARAT